MIMRGGGVFFHKSSNCGGSVDISHVNQTLRQKLRRHTVAPRGPRIHYENYLQGVAVAPGLDELAKSSRWLCEAAVVAPWT